MRARYYNVDIKPFINQDVLTGTLERISSLNRYSYVEGNPISYLDPFGLAIAMLQTVVNFASVMVGMLSLLAFIAPQVAFVTSAILWMVSLILDLKQLVRHDASEDAREAFEKDMWGGLLILAPVLNECGGKVLHAIGAFFDNAIATIASVFAFMFE